MFNLQKENLLLHLSHGEDHVLKDVQFELHLNDMGKVDLDFVEVKTEQKANQLGAYKRCEYVYTKDDKVEFSFIMHSYEHTVHAYTDLTIHGERVMGRNDYLSPKNGVVIKMKEIGESEGLVAFYRHKDWWTRPHFEKDITALPERTQSLLWASEKSYYYLVPLVGPVFKSELEGTDQGFQLSVSSYDSGRSQCQTPIFVLGKGENPFDLSKLVTKQVQAISGKSSRSLDEKRYPQQLDYLGWCSWDAFYQDVNEEGILNKMKELNEKQVPVKWIMIDDGWSQINNERLSGFEPDATKFPQGFKVLTDQLKGDYGVDAVGVWHTLAGYWGGIDPDSSLVSEMAPHLLRTNGNKFIPYPNKGKGFGFWDAWHDYLQQQGIDFVKVDGQSAVNNFMEGQMSIGESSLETHKALEASVGIHFDQCMINCMGMASENIWNRPISSVSRSSDDFVPDDDNGFAEHALQNVYNSFYHGEIYWGDWDMFWTKHKDAKRHAVLRALSGGPIYTSDRVDQTDPEVLQPLVYKDGRILRCDQPGRPTTDTLLVDPVKGQLPLKVWNTSNGIGLVATFNVSDQKVDGKISPSDVEGIAAEEYIIYDYFNQKVHTVDKEGSLPVSLDKEGFSYYLVIPRKSSVKPLGLIDKYVSPATFSEQYTSEDKVVVRVREGGRFAFYSESEPSKVTVNGSEVAVNRLKADDLVYVVDCSSIQDESIMIEINR
jgi:raffinose synthase